MGDRICFWGRRELARHPPGPAGPRGSPAQASGSWPGEEARGADFFAARRRAAGGRLESQPGLRGGSRRRWAMHLGRPEAEVGEDLFDDRGLVNDSDDPHGAPAPWAAQPIHLIDLFDEAGPPVLEGPRDRGRWYLEEFPQDRFCLSRLCPLRFPRLALL